MVSPLSQTQSIANLRRRRHSLPVSRGKYPSYSSNPFSRASSPLWALSPHQEGDLPRPRSLPRSCTWDTTCRCSSRIASRPGPGRTFGPCTRGSRCWRGPLRSRGGAVSERLGAGGCVRLERGDRARSTTGAEMVKCRRVRLGFLFVMMRRSGLFNGPRICKKAGPDSCLCP